MVSSTFSRVDSLYLTTALTVLQHCSPYLNESFRDITAASLQELTGALFFNRNTSVSASGGAKQMPYTGAFLRVYNLLVKYANSLDLYERRSVIEGRVMDRVLSQLDGLWVKACFMSWRVYCRRIKEKKARFRQLMDRSMAAFTLPPFINRWRQHAHKITMNAKIAQSNALSKELDELLSEERDVQSKYEEVSEEVREKMKLVGAATSRLEQGRARLSVLQELLAEATVSLKEHWWTWKVCMGLLFGDARKRLPTDVGATSSISRNYVQNITDSSSVYARRAKQRTDRVGIRHIEYILHFHGLLPFTDDSAVTVSSTNRAEQALQLISSERDFYTLCDVESAYLQLCHPISAPFRLNDLTTSCQPKLKLLLIFMNYTSSGSHCSLFLPQNVLSCGDRYKPILEHNPDDTSETIPKDGGDHMVKDVSSGFDSLHGCTEYNDKYMLAIRECMQFSSLQQAQDYISFFADRWKGFLPFKRDRIEGIMLSLVSDGDKNVIEALYPKNGIKNISDIIEYITKMSEFSGWTMMDITERIDYLYPITADEEFTRDADNPDCVALFSENAQHIRGLFIHLREGETPYCSEEKVKTFLTEILDLDAGEAEEIFSHCSSENHGIGMEDMNTFLLVLLEYFEPSPFVPVCQKLGELLHVINSFVLDL
ncbi:hypothetical protein AGDE_11367 [Angomonas deanei]|nr:hypothetical protein AGDE_11367 [Angomonas deanei]|eukprot:EPY26395.1 hypothetical protein AGDE_11367 [Angomonas deanei]